MNFINNPFQVAVVFYANYALLLLLHQQLVPDIAAGIVNPAFNFLLPIIMVEPLATGLWMRAAGKRPNTDNEASLVSLRIIFMAIPLTLLDIYHLSLLIDRLLQ